MTSKNITRTFSGNPASRFWNCSGVRKGGARLRGAGSRRGTGSRNR